MPNEYPKDWQKYLEMANGNVERLARLESRIEENHTRVMSIVQGVKEDVADISDQVKDMHEVLYKNGLTSKVQTMWEWRRTIDKVIVGVITALLTAIGLYFFHPKDASADKELIEHLKKIEQKLDANQNKTSRPAP